MKAHSFSLITFLLLAPLASAQIAQDGSICSSSVTDSSQTVTFQCTVGNGANRALAVLCGGRDGTNSNVASLSITWNSSETFTVPAQASCSNSSRAAHAGYLLNPSSGTHDIVVTWNGTVDTSRCHLYSLTGVDQTDGFDQAADTCPGPAGTSATLSPTVTTDAWIVGITETNDGAGSFSGDGNITLDFTGILMGSGSLVSQAVWHRGPVTGATSNTVSWTNNHNYAAAALSFRPIAALMPDYGLLATSASNTTREVILPDHWSLTQSKNSWTLSATGLSGNGSSCTATLSSDPTSGSPRLQVGGTVTTTGMSDSAGDQVKKAVTALSPSSVTFSCSFNGTTGNGTLKSDIWPEPAIGDTFIQPNSTFNSTPEIKLFDETGESGAVICRWYYRGTPWISLTQEYAMVFCGGEGMVIVNTSTFTVQCSGFVGSGANQPRWSRDPNDPYTIYYQSGKSILKKSVSGSTCSSATTVKTFSGYDAIAFTPGARISRVNGDLFISIVGCAAGGSSGCPDGGQMDVFIYNITDDSLGSIYTVAASCANIDELHYWPDTMRMVVNYSGTNSTECLGGMDLIDADGTFNRKIESANRHMAMGIDSDNEDIVQFSLNDGSGPSGCTSGVIIEEIDTATRRCLFNKTNANPAGTGTCSSMTVEFGMEGHWTMLAVVQENAAVPEGYLGSGWDTAWCRGANENWACLTKGTIDGTNNCMRLGHRWTSSSETDGSGTVGNRAPSPGFSMLLESDPTGSVPSCAFYGTDFRLATNNGTTTLVMSQMITPLRSGGCGQ